MQDTHTPTIPIANKTFRTILGLEHVDSSLLKNLMWFRLFETFALLFVGFSCHYIFKLPVPYLPFISCLMLLVLGNIFLIYRLGQTWQITQLELFLNLLIDSVILSVFISSTGGAANPFVSLYLVLIAVSAAILSTGLSIAITICCALMYSYLFTMMPDTHSNHDMQGDSFQLHLIGMWINFLLSASCLLIFIHLLRRAVSMREEQINLKKEQTLRDEHILAIGSLAAGAAHELSTPLSTVNLLSENLLKKQLDDDSTNDLHQMREQLLVCKQTVDSLRISATDPNNFLLAKSSLKQHLESIFDNWLLLWPNINEHIHYHSHFNDFDIALDRRLQQTLLSLLNNASEASLSNQSQEVFIDINCDVNKDLSIHIFDEGSGVSETIKSTSHKAVLSSKRKGIGLGLMLSHSNIQQLGGTIVIENSIHPETQDRQNNQATTLATGACATLNINLSGDKQV